MITTQLIDEIRISNDKNIRLIKGDITDQNIDVIVNPANSFKTWWRCCWCYC
jgi:hypothetical protein